MSGILNLLVLHHSKSRPSFDRMMAAITNLRWAKVIYVSTDISSKDFMVYASKFRGALSSVAIIFSAIRIPSHAALVMPPAYPAPSPQG